MTAFDDELLPGIEPLEVEAGNPDVLALHVFRRSDVMGARPVLANKYAIVVVQNADLASTQGFGMAICNILAATEVTKQASAQALRLAWPDGRALKVTHADRRPA